MLLIIMLNNTLCFRDQCDPRHGRGSVTPSSYRRRVPSRPRGWRTLSTIGRASTRPARTVCTSTSMCPGYVMLRYVMLCYVMLCYVMLCYVMLCYVMLCYVMLCYVVILPGVEYCFCLATHSGFAHSASGHTDSEFLLVAHSARYWSAHHT